MVPQRCYAVCCVQTALRACFEHSHDLEEVHFVLFGSDTYNMWKAQADKFLKPLSEAAPGTLTRNNLHGQSECLSLIACTLQTKNRESPQTYLNQLNQNQCNLHDMMRPKIRK